MAKLTSGKGWRLIPDELERPKAVSQPVQIKIRLERRRGKYVTVIAGLVSYGEPRMKRIAKELRSLCGAGGTVKNGNVEIQGDNVSVVENWLAEMKDKEYNG